MIHKQIL